MENNLYARVSLLTTTFSREIPAASCSARIECWKRNVNVLNSISFFATVLVFDSAKSERGLVRLTMRVADL